MPITDFWRVRDIPGRVVYYNDFYSGTATALPDPSRWTTGTSGVGSAVNNGGGFNWTFTSGGGAGRYAYGQLDTARFLGPNQGILIHVPLAVMSIGSGELSIGTRTQGALVAGLPSDGYVLTLSGAATTLFQYTAATRHSLGTISPSIDAATGYFIRWEIVGTRHSIAVWRDVDPEPHGLPSPSNTILTIYDETWPQAGVAPVFTFRGYTNSGSTALNWRINQLILYEPQTISNVGYLLATVLIPGTATARTFAATIPISSKAKAVTLGGKQFATHVPIAAVNTISQFKKAERVVAKVPTAHSSKAVQSVRKGYLAKPNTSSSAKALLPTQTKHFVNKVAQATNLKGGLSQLGTVSFSGKFSEGQNTKLRRTAAAPIPLPRAYQSKPSSSISIRADLRSSTSRRQGKAATTTSSKARLAYRHGIMAKVSTSSKAKAAIDVTTVAQGNVPAIPANITSARVANHIICWTNNYSNFTTFSAFDHWSADWGFDGYSTGSTLINPTLEQMPFHFYFEGTDTSNVVDPLTKPASYVTKCGNHHAWMGYGAPTVYGGTYGTIMNPPTGIGSWKRAHPDKMFLIGLYMRTSFPGEIPYMGDWYDDTRWNGWVRTFQNLAAGAKAVGAQGFTMDNEYSEQWEPRFKSGNDANKNPIYYTSTNRPGSPTPGMIILEHDTGLYKRWTGTTWETRTLAELKTKVEARGFQLGQAVYNNFPDCGWLIYEWKNAGCIINSSVAPYSSDYPWGGYVTTNEDQWQSLFYYGMMRAAAAANGPNSFFWRWDDQAYEFYEHVRYTGHLQRMGPAQSSLLSQRVPAATRDYMMMRYGTILPSWARGGGPQAQAQWPILGEPNYSNQQMVYRQYSHFGWRSEYLQQNQNNDTPLGPLSQGSPLYNLYTYAGTNPPGGHGPGLLAAKSPTTPAPDSTPIVVGTITQARSGSTVTLTFTASHATFGIRNAHWKQYASNGTSVLAQGEAVLVYHENGGDFTTNFNNASTSCTITIPNATSGLYVILDIYSSQGQRTSRRVQFEGGVVGPPPSGNFEVTAVGHGVAQATVETELTATVTNNSSTAVANAGAAFYDAVSGVEYGWGGILTSLAPGASLNVSTVTSPNKSGWIPATAGSYTIRAKPSNNFVDSNIGTMDQTFTVAAAPPPPPPGTRVWASTSPINTVKNQTGIVFMPGADSVIQNANVIFNNSGFGHPTYFAQASDHSVTFNLGHNQITNSNGGSLLKAAPSGMNPASGTDGVMFVQFTDNTWIDMYQVTRVSDTVFNCNEYVHSTDGPGNIDVGTGFGNPANGQRAGTTGIGSPQVTGTILARDVAAGTIPHGIFTAGSGDFNTAVSFLGDGQAGTVQVLPAINNDVGGTHGPCPEGGLLLIPTATAMPPSLTVMEQALFTALKTYGMYVCDTIGSGYSAPSFCIVGDGSPAVQNAFSQNGITTVLHLLRLVKTW